MSDFVKIVITAPIENADAVRRAMGEAGAGKAGNYSFCSFSSRGQGRFLSNEHANPHIGKAGYPEIVEEERIEVLCERALAKAVIDAALAAHPYEEPMYDIFPLIDINEL